MNEAFKKIVEKAKKVFERKSVLLPKGFIEITKANFRTRNFQPKNFGKGVNLFY